MKETVNNVAKHSAAKSAKVEARTTADRLELIVTDDGHGFDSGRADNFSDGLINMRERMSAIGGRCTIESHPTVSGCRTTFECPFSKPR